MTIPRCPEEAVEQPPQTGGTNGTMSAKREQAHPEASWRRTHGIGGNPNGRIFPGTSLTVACPSKERQRCHAERLIHERSASDFRLLGRSSGFRISLLAAPSRPSRLPNSRQQRLAVACCSVRPRLQRRDRDGIAPSSLFFSPATSRRNTQVCMTGSQRGTSHGLLSYQASVQSQSATS